MGSEMCIRDRELKVQCCLGLSPSGVITMFLVEGVLYGILGIVIGYILGFVLNKTLIGIGILPMSFYLNFSSLSVSLTTLVILLVSLISIMYPAYKASYLVNPSLRRRWELPTRPRGDEWYVPFPFRIPSEREVFGILVYLREYFSGEARETRFFRVEGLNLSLHPKEPKITMRVTLAPFELQIVQDVTIMFRQAEKGFAMDLYLKKLSGSRSVWTTSNVYFIDSLRKQLLLWRSLPTEVHRGYIKTAMASLSHGDEENPKS